MSNSEIWVVVELLDGQATTTSLELLTRARDLSSSVSAITWDEDAMSLAEEVGKFGVTTLYDVGPIQGILPGAPVARAIAELLHRVGAPEAIFVPSSNDGRDIAGRLSARLDRPVLTNIVGVSDDNGLITEHLVLGGTIKASARFTGQGPGIMVIRDRAFEMEPSGNAPAVVVSATISDVPGGTTATITNSVREDHRGLALEEATVVGAGGRGMGDIASYALIEEAARLLHGAPGASRAIVDAGWVPYSYQVGQTGKTVKPMVYLACGISGATQHLVGMNGAQNVVAINKDAAAPIFGVADLGIVGDVQQILPALIEMIRSRALR